MSRLKTLEFRDSIQVDTNHGLCEIQLLFGSITKLSRDDKVDVLVVSAFPDDYSPNPASVIGAVERELGVSVAKLAKDKEEDLRNVLSCWWSKPLPEKCSFGRILCFEGCFKQAVRSPALVGNVFKALVSICKEKDVTVTMPLLTSKDKDYSQETMLRLMIDAAIHWMQIGLPLKLLKIVIFARYEDEIDESLLLPYFKDLKAKWMGIFVKEKMQPKEHPITYDIYLSYSQKDEALAKIMRDILEERQHGIKIFSEHQNLNENVSWQDDVYKFMVSCARVITILSPNYIADNSCLEQYNIALCCSRSMERGYLAPFYVTTINELPTYMCLIQYIDCRPPDRVNMTKACSVVTDWLSLNLSKIQHHKADDITSDVTSRSEHKAMVLRDKSNDVSPYDVFISYSHQNSDIAHRIRDEILSSQPDWSIFIDVAELKTGMAWQVKLYHSIEASRIVVVLISPSYIASKVCQEEYNLASAMHSDFAYSTKIIPLLVETTDGLPAWCMNHTPIDCRRMSDRDLKQFVKRIDVYNEYQQLDKPRMTSIEDVTSNWRSEHIESNLKCFPDVALEELLLQKPRSDVTSGDSDRVDIVLSYHKEDERWAQFLSKRLKDLLPNARISLPEISQVRNAILDDSIIALPLLSNAFLKSAELLEELNISLCRHRFSGLLVLFPIYLEALPSTPAYLHLLWSLFSCADKIWTSSSSQVNRLLDASLLPQEKCLAVASHVIAHVLAKMSSSQGSFKTLLSIDELSEMTLQLRGKNATASLNGNPLFFSQR